MQSSLWRVFSGVRDTCNDHIKEACYLAQGAPHMGGELSPLIVKEHDHTCRHRQLTTHDGFASTYDAGSGICRAQSSEGT
jgi:hypothetical protein